MIKDEDGVCVIIASKNMALAVSIFTNPNSNNDSDNNNIFQERDRKLTHGSARSDTRD